MPPAQTEDVTFGPHTLRLQAQKQGWAGLVVTPGRFGKEKPAPLFATTRDELIAKLQTEALQSKGGFVGYQGAWSRFLSLFPGGLDDPDFQKREVAPKRRASEFANTHCPPKADTANWHDTAQSAVRAMQMTELLHPIEKAKLKDVFLGDKGQTFFEASCRMNEGNIDKAATILARHFPGSDIGNWRTLTYLPFLWQPGKHMFLRPTFLRHFAEAVGHPFDFNYQSEIDPPVYHSLLSLMQQTQTELFAGRDTDNIDIQSFIWVASEYKDSDVSPKT